MSPYVCSGWVISLSLGEWFALPLIEHAGSKKIGDVIFNQIFHPISRDLVTRCDACLRMGGPSKGADEMVSLARRSEKTVFMTIDEVPSAAPEVDRRILDASSS